MNVHQTEWVASGPEEVAPGVFRIPLPLPNDGLRAVNVYALAEGDHVAMVDAGWALAESESELRRALDLIGGYGVEDIRDFFVTHAHRDHYTQAVAIRRSHAVRVSLGAGEQPWLKALRSPEGGRWSNQMRQLRRAGADPVRRALEQVPSDPPSVNWEDPDNWLQDTTLLLTKRTLRVIPTPGHTRGHVVFHDADGGLLFAGDHVLPHITPSVGFEGVESESPLRDFLASLRLVRAMPDAILLPAHGPAGGSVHQRIDELLDHHGRRLEESMQAVGDDGATAYEVAGRLRWTRRGRHLDELDVVNQMMAVIETALHLDLLVERGVLGQTEDVGCLRYLRI